jgi:predicted acetyltransferase
VRDSYLEGERVVALAGSTSATWLDLAASDFDAYVDQQRGVQFGWGVPITRFWYVAGTTYIGTLVIRHWLTPELARVGGHVGYHVVAPWRRQGHATRMLAQGITECGQIGLERILLTCAPGNDASKRVIIANGGVHDGNTDGEERYWITIPNAVTGPGGPDGSAVFERAILVTT